MDLLITFAVLLAGLITAGGGIFLLGLIILGLAKLDIAFTTVPTGQMKIVVRGKTRHRFLLNSQKEYFDEGTGEVTIKPANYKDSRNIVAKVLDWALGIYWIGIPPFYQLETFHLSEGESWENIEKYEVKKYDPDEVLESLQIRHTYPLLTVETELEDNFLIDTTSNVTLRMVRPDRAIFDLGGAYLGPILEAMRGAVADYANAMKFKDFRQEDKSLPNSPFVLAIMGLNNSLAPGQPGTIEAYGVAIEKVAYVKFRLSPTEGQKRVQAAVQAAAVAREEGQAKVDAAEKDAAAATHEAKAIRTRARAAATATKMKRQAAGGTNEVLLAEQRTAAASALGSFKGSSLVVGTDSGVILNTPTPSPTPTP